jgi:hypothetical protein
VNAAGPETVLRPLGIGEILDRAVNVCVRNFVTLGVIYLVFVIPLSVIQYYATKDFATVLQAIVESAKSGHGAASADVLQKLGSANAGYSGINAWTVLLWVAAIAVGPLPAGALIAAVAAVYLKQPTSFALAYRVGLARWANLLGVELMYCFAGGFLYLIAVLGILAVFFAVGVLYSVANTAGIVLGVVVGIVVLVLAIVVVTLVALALQMSFLACVIERANFVTSFLSGLRRVFTGIGVRRALPFGLAYIAIFIGVGIVGGVGEVVLTGLLRSPAAGVAYGAVVRLISAAFSTAFVVIFYYDLRVREEGLDLQLQAESVAPSSLPPLPAS